MGRGGIPVYDHIGLRGDLDWGREGGISDQTSSIHLHQKVISAYESNQGNIGKQGKSRQAKQSWARALDPDPSGAAQYSGQAWFSPWEPTTFDHPKHPAKGSRPGAGPPAGPPSTGDPADSFERTSALSWQNPGTME